MGTETNVDRTRAAALLKALTPALRFRIMVALTDGERTPKELSEELGANLKRVSENVRLLEDEGFVELVGTDQRGGGTMHIFSATVRPLLDTESSHSLSKAEREKISEAIYSLMIKDIVRATEAGTMDSIVDRVLMRTPLVLDGKGFEEADEETVRYVDNLLEIKARSAARLAESGEVGTNAASAAAVYPMP